MKIQIIIQENTKSEIDEIIGKESEPIFEYTDFWVKDELIESFWVDKKGGQIIFSVRGDDYHTPYSDKTFKLFLSLFESDSSVGPPR